MVGMPPWACRRCTMVGMPPWVGIPGGIYLPGWVSLVVYASLPKVCRDSRARRAPENPPFFPFHCWPYAQVFTFCTFNTFNVRKEGSREPTAPRGAYPFHCWAGVEEPGMRLGTLLVYPYPPTLGIYGPPSYPVCTSLRHDRARAPGVHPPITAFNVRPYLPPFPVEECVPFHPENKPPAQEKPAHCDQQTRYRKHSRTRRSRIF